MSHTSKIQVVALNLTLIVMFSSLFLAHSASTPTPSARIGIINIQEAIMECNEGKKELDALQAKFTPKQDELGKLNDEVVNLKKQYDAQKDKLTSEASASQLKALKAKQNTLQRNLANAQNEVQRAEQEVINRIGNKMMKVLEKYAKDHGYSLMLDVANPQTPVLWADQGINITKEIIQAYNAENPAAAQAPSKSLSAPSTPPPFTLYPKTPGSKPKQP
jgi:outer membrane protein